MNKRFLYQILSVAIFLVALVGYLLVQFNVIKLPEGIHYNFWLFIFMILLGFGLLNLVSGILRRNRVTLFSSAPLLIGAFIYASIEYFKLNAWIIVVCSLVILGVCVFLAIFVSGGVSPMTADNDKVGYKNYSKRKAIKDKKEDKEERIKEKEIKKGKADDITIKSFKDDK